MTEPMPRLLVVATVTSTIDQFLMPYINHFRSLGWTVDAASSSDFREENVRDAVDQWHELSFSRSARAIADPRNLSSLRRLLEGGDYDLVHVHTPIAAFALRLAVASLPTERRPAVVYTAHGFHFVPDTPRWSDRAYRTAERIGGRYTDRLIVINPADAETAVAYKLVSPERVVEMPGIGIDLDHYRTDAAMKRSVCELRSELGVGPHEHIVTMIAEFNPRKNHKNLVNAFARLDRSDTHLVFAGSASTAAASENLPAVRSQCRQLGVHERVHFLGEISDVRPLIAASSLTTLPSRREGLSRAVLESLAMGVPVLGADVRGIADSVAPDGGILVHPDDVEGITNGLVQLIERPLDHFDPVAVRTRMHRYRTDHLISLHEDLYRLLLLETSTQEIGSV